MAAAWNVLVIDDEPDIHDVTRLVLRRKTWRDRPIDLAHATSAAQARGILGARGAPVFHCALVDVVMESTDAGLQLCDFIRSTMPRTTRIVLRTGQAGAAPPERVMNDYDTDYYLATAEVTGDRLFTTLRACFRSSLDIAALLAVSAQLRAFTLALQEPSTTEDGLAEIMRESLRFIEDKYAAKLGFVSAGATDVGSIKASFGPGMSDVVAKAQLRGLAPMELHAGPEVGLEAGTYVVLTSALQARGDRSVGARLKEWFQSLVTESAEARGAAVAVHFDREPPERIKREFLQDLDLFVANWKVASHSLQLWDRIVRDRLETTKNFVQSG